MLLYRAALPVSHQTLAFVSGIVRRHRREIGSAWRKLTGRSGVSGAGLPAQRRTGRRGRRRVLGIDLDLRRHVHETVELPAHRAPKLAEALREAKTGHGLPGPRRNPRAHRPHRRRPALLLRQTPQAWDKSADPFRTLDLPGSTHDTTAARLRQTPAALTKAGLIAVADKGYQGLDPTGNHLLTPYKGRDKPGSEKDANSAHARPWSRRTRQRPTHNLADPPHTPLLPPPHRHTRQSHPRSYTPTNEPRQDEKAQ